MDIKCVPLNKETHFPLMQKWWEERGFPGAGQAFLPERGVFTFVDGKPVFGAFLIETNANLAIIDYGASDPKASSEARDAAFDTTFRALFELAGLLGYPMVSAASNMESIGERYKSFGLMEFDKNVTIYGGFTCHKLQ